MRTLVDDGRLDRLDTDGLLVDAKDASTFACKSYNGNQLNSRIGKEETNKEQGRRDR
jgi:hypothetical protein